jgi:hypothetical protein
MNLEEKYLSQSLPIDYTLIKNKNQAFLPSFKGKINYFLLILLLFAFNEEKLLYVLC